MDSARKQKTRIRKLAGDNKRVVQTGGNKHEKDKHKKKEYVYFSCAFASAYFMYVHSVLACACSCAYLGLFQNCEASSHAGHDLMTGMFVKEPTNKF